MSVFLAKADTESVMGKYRAPLVQPYQKTTAKGKLVESNHKILVAVHHKGSSDPYTLTDLISDPGIIHTIDVSHDDLVTPIELKGSSVYVCVHVPYSRFSDFDRSMLGNDAENGGRVRLVVDLAGVPYTLRSLVKICETDSRIRFTGADMMLVPGLRVGRFDASDIKGSRPKYKTVATVSSGFEPVEVVDLDSLDGVVESKVYLAKRRPSSRKKVSTSVLGTSDVVDVSEPEGTAKASPNKQKPKARPASMGMLFGNRKRSGF